MVQEGTKGDFLAFVVWAFGCACVCVSFKVYFLICIYTCASGVYSARREFIHSALLLFFILFKPYVWMSVAEWLTPFWGSRSLEDEGWCHGNTQVRPLRWVILLRTDFPIAKVKWENCYCSALWLFNLKLHIVRVAKTWQLKRDALTSTLLIMNVPFLLTLVWCFLLVSVSVYVCVSCDSKLLWLECASLLSASVY